MTDSPTRAAVYLRISQDKTGEQAGVSRQREDCINLVETQGWALHEVYVDNDISATSGKARPDYRRMLKAIQAGDIDAVVAWHPDRLYRKLVDLEELINAIDRHNVVMRTVRAGEIDLSTPTGRMLARILSATAQAEGEMKADRWARSWRQGREQGKPPGTGSRLFGYTREGEIVEVEAEIAREMAADILAGQPILTIARGLEADGVLTTRGNVWTPRGVKVYLTNPRIAGFSTLGRSVTVGRDEQGAPKKRRVVEIVADGKWEPILDRETWESVRAMLTARTRDYAPRVSLLNGLLLCGKCDTRMVTSASRGKRTYRCPNRPGSNLNGCGGVSSYAESIEEVVESYARAKLADPKVRDHLLRLSTSAGPELLNEINALEQRLRELEASLDEPGVPVATILRAIDRTKERLGECQKRLGAATPVRIPAPGDAWPEDLERRRRLVDLVVARVRLNPAEGRPRTFDPRRVEIDPA